MDIPSRYAAGKIVGRGAYGIVCSAVDTTNGERVAIKKIGKVFEDLVDGKRILRELTLLAFINHPNLLYLKDVFRPTDPDSFADIYLVTQFMETDIGALLKCRVNLVEEHCRYYMYQLACGLRYLHAAGILHRDLKPANLLTNGDCELKICDFGLARARGALMTDYVVTRWYRPPELLLVCDGYHTAIDMWAVGCLAYEILTRKPLFPGKDYIHQITLIVDTVGSPKMSDLKLVKSNEAKAFIRTMPPREPISMDILMPRATTNMKHFVSRLLTFDPDQRMTAEEAIAHPWLASMIESDEGSGTGISPRGSGQPLGFGAGVDVNRPRSPPPHPVMPPGLFKFEHEGDLDEPTLRRLFWNEINRFHENSAHAR